MKHMTRILRHHAHWLLGLVALIWVALRSGTNPKRVTYPCQQAAMPIAASWLVAVAALFGGSLLLRRLARYSLPLAIVGGIAWYVATTFDASRAGTTAYNSLPVWEVPNPVSTVFVMDSIPPTVGTLAAGDSTVPDAFLRDPAIDTLLAMMAMQGTHLHNTALHPQGIVHANDIVIIKGNYQWTSRNTSSTDRVKGLIRQILAHPDGFTGEIIVCDNTQDGGTGINHNDNNSEDEQQSIIDVVNTFRAKHFPVYLMDWRIYWDDVVPEYSAGSYTSGYTYDTLTKISYPKFRSPSGNHYISLRYGIWDSLTSTYNHDRLCIIDVPVLKAHGIAGATIAMKNWIGVMTTAYANERYGGDNPMHDYYFMGTYALVARTMAVTYPRLTIIDAAWTARQGPYFLEYCVKTSMLLGSTDPMASSWYAAKFILTPIALRPYETNPDLPGSKYNSSLTNWLRFFRDSAAIVCTKDSAEMSVFDRRVLRPLSVQLVSFTGEVTPAGVLLKWRTLSEYQNLGFYVQRRAAADSQFADLSNGFVPGHGTTNEPHDYEFLDSTATLGSWYYRLKHVDLDSTEHFTEPILVTIVVSVGEKPPHTFRLLQNYPNPFNPVTTMEFEVADAGVVTLRVYDVGGREVALLLREKKSPGRYSVQWIASDIPSGVYFYRLDAGGVSETKKLLLIR